MAKKVLILEGLRLIDAIKPRGKEKFEGREWEVDIIGPATPGDLLVDGSNAYIRSQNGYYYRTQALQESVPLWEKVKVYDNHLTDEEFQKSEGMRSISSDWIGVIVNPSWSSAKNTLIGTLKVVDEGLRTKLLNAYNSDVLDAVGLSIDALAETEKVNVAGAAKQVVNRIIKAMSVDIVANPAAGGRFDRLIAGMDEEELEVEDNMPLELEDIKKVVDESLDQKFGELEERLEELETEEEEEVEDETTEEGSEGDLGSEEEEELPLAVTEAVNRAQELLSAAEKREQLTRCRETLSKKLSESGLPASFQEVVASQFRDKVFEEDDLDAAIKVQVDALSSITESGRVVIPDGARISVSPLSELDQFELAFLRLVAGNTKFNELMEPETGKRLYEVAAIDRYIEAGRPALPRATRLSEWYYDFTQDYDALGHFANQRLREANVTSQSMTSLVKNTLNLLLAADYSVRYQWWDSIVRQEDVDTLDQATLVRLYGISNLAEIDEGDAYTETDWADEEETASYVKRGNYVGVTLETFLLDKLSKVRTIPNRLSNAWYNTVSALVSGVFTVNTLTGPVLADNGALFNATAVTTGGGHQNLLTAELSQAGYAAARLEMMKQTDQVLGAGKRLNIQPKFMLVPADLESTALIIRNSEKLSGADYQSNDINPYFQKFEVVVVPEWTDVKDWALVADPTVFPAVWLIWLRGKRTPELFTAEDEKAGAMFSNDEIRFKVRQFGFRFSATYDCGPVSDFRPLHKSNVT